LGVDVHIEGVLANGLNCCVDVTFHDFIEVHARHNSFGFPSTFDND